jgi:hypothetical protein
MDMDVQHGHGRHAALFGNTTWIWTMDMHGCWNADKKISPASLVSISRVHPFRFFFYFVILHIKAKHNPFCLVFAIFCKTIK